MNGYGRNQRVQSDRSGNPYVIKRAKQKTDRKTGELLPVFVGYVEMNGQLLQIEVSNNNKDYNDGKDSKWLKVKKLKRRSGTSRF